jgi:hypothetical protein
MLIITENLQKNRNIFIKDFINFKNFCSQEKVNSLRNEFANYYVVEVLEQACKDYKNDRIKLNLKEHHNSEVENILKILNSEFTLSEYKILKEEDMKEDMKEENEAVTVEIGFNEEETYDSYDYHYRFNLKRIKEMSKQESFKKILRSTFQLGHSDYSFENNIIKVSKDKLRHRKLQINNLIKISDYKFEKDDLDEMIPIQNAIERLYIDNQDLLDRFLSIIKSSNKFHFIKEENFENVRRGLLNIASTGETALIECNQNEKMRKDAKSMLKTGDISVESISRYTGLSLEEISQLEDESSEDEDF